MVDNILSHRPTTTDISTSHNNKNYDMISNMISTSNYQHSKMYNVASNQHESHSNTNFTNDTSLANTTWFENTTSYNASNSTALPENFSMPIYAQALIILMYSTITVLSIGGNVIVIYIILAYQRMRTVTNYFIVNLACADILMAALCIPFTFVANVLMLYWPFGQVMCPIVLYAQVVTVFLSAFTLVAISVDRYIAVIYPLRPRMTTKQAYIIISAIWMLALTVSLPVIVLASTYPEEDEYGIMRNKCDEMWPNPQHRYIFSLVIMVLQYFLPLFVLMFTYTRIGVVIWIKRIPGEAESNRDQRVAASKRKMVKMMLTVVIIYALCWLPIHTIILIGDRYPAIWTFRYIQVIWIACHWLSMSSCCYNPMVYCWMNSTFRNGFRYVLRFLPCIDLNSNPNSRSNSRQRYCLSTQTASTYVSTIRSSCLPDRREVGGGNGFLKSVNSRAKESSDPTSKKNYKEMQIYSRQYERPVINGHYNSGCDGSREHQKRLRGPASQSNKTMTLISDGMTSQQQITAAECEPLTCT